MDIAREYMFIYTNFEEEFDCDLTLANVRVTGDVRRFGCVQTSAIVWMLVEGISRL